MEVSRQPASSQRIAPSLPKAICSTAFSKRPFGNWERDIRHQMCFVATKICIRRLCHQSYSCTLFTSESMRVCFERVKRETTLTFEGVKFIAVFKYHGFWGGRIQTSFQLAWFLRGSNSYLFWNCMVFEGVKFIAVFKYSSMVFEGVKFSLQRSTIVRP